MNVMPELAQGQHETGTAATTLRKVRPTILLWQRSRPSPGQEPLLHSLRPPQPNLCGTRLQHQGLMGSEEQRGLITKGMALGSRNADVNLLTNKEAQEVTQLSNSP